MNKLDQHSAVQRIAKQVLDQLSSTLNADDSEFTIASRAVAMLAEFEVTETWYYKCPAFVLLGTRSCISISGRDYLPSHETAGQSNVVTVDLSPALNGVWGDCARTFIIEQGIFTSVPVEIEHQRGMKIESLLHDAMLSFVSPTTTFHELHEFGNAEILRHGFENLDFQGNLGHSIVSQREDRLYIEPANHRTLGSVPFFTFEPHVREAGGKWGFKHEEIYYFDSNGRIRVL